MNGTRNIMVVLAFEGPDKGGKGALIREINRQSGYEFLCIDRFTGSAWVYDRLSGRRNREQELLAFESELTSLKSAIVLNVLVSSDPKLLRDRIVREDECVNERLTELNTALTLYQQYSREVARLPTIAVDTSHITPAESAAQIIREVRKICRI